MCMYTCVYIYNILMPSKLSAMRFWLSACVCVCVCVYVCVCVRAYIHIWMYLCICICAYISICMNVHIDTCVPSKKLLVNIY